MGGDQHGHSLDGEGPDDVQDLADELGVQRAGDLVQEEKIGIHREGPDDRDALLLAAGEAVRVFVGPVPQPEPGEELPGLPFGITAARAEPLLRAQRDVPQHRHVREQVEGLEDDPHPPPHAVLIDTGRGDVRAPHQDAAAVDRFEEVDAPQEGRLPRARRPDQARHLVLGKVQ
jgi:hypothetical protein